MSFKLKNSFTKNFQYDFPASIVVFLVALPLCLGIALASGAPLFSGLIAGIIGGLVVSLISDSPLGVSGPGAGLAIIVFASIRDLGSFDAFLLAVVFAGVFQILFSLLKAGIIGHYFPSAVIKGMLSGIGILIILKQIPHLFGYDADPEGDFSFAQIDGHNTLSELFYMLQSFSLAPFLVGLISLLILILWEELARKKPLLKSLPAPLVAVGSGIFFNVLLKSSESYHFTSDQLVSIPVFDSFKNLLTQLNIPDFSQIYNPKIYVIALTLAVVASLETLLCLEATDKLDPQRRESPPNRELFAQGVGNIISGLIGGLPITQVIVRSSANIQSGGRTKIASFFHGLFLLVCILFCAKFINLIPLASLAAILLIVGYKLAKPILFKEMYAKGLSHFAPFLVTILGIVFLNLLAGISLGMIVALVELLWHHHKNPFHFDDDHYKELRVVRIQLAENVSFLNKSSIIKTLNHVPKYSQVVVDASKVKTIHTDVLELIEDFQKRAEERKISLVFEGLDLKNKFDSVKKFKKLVSSIQV